MFYIIATPIGNLSDITYRSVQTLKECNYILCEDTRISKRLLEKYEITTPLISYHKMNESKKNDSIIQDLKSGKNIALISDAGTPLINDPGQKLIQQLANLGLGFTALPGPCAFINASCLLGMEFSRIQFLGFPPEKISSRKDIFLEAIHYPGISSFYVAPHDLEKYLGEIVDLHKDQPLILIREMTKKFEERIALPAKDLLICAKERSLKGEMVLCFAGKRESININSQKVMQLLIDELNIKTSTAAKITAKITGEDRKKLYEAWNER